jgi:hypothetical protein
VRGQTGTALWWPLWSWRNLSVTAAAVLLVLFGVGRVVEPAKITLAAPNMPGVTATSTPSPSLTTGWSASASASASSPVRVPAPVLRTTSPTSAAPVVHADESVTRMATAFAQAWSASGRSQQEWTRGIQPFVTPALAAGLAHTDPVRVPATKITGEAVLLTGSATSAQVKVPTDGGSIVVTLRRASSGPWLVSDVAPAGQPPGALTPDLRPRPSPTGG